MSEELVITEKRGHIQVLTLNRPEDMNAFNTALATALGEALEAMDNDTDIRVGVLTGAGRGFSAGMDLKQFADGGIDAMPNVGDRGFAGITEKSCAKPLIAAVEGFALAGGLEVALSCDLIVASEDAKLGLPEPRRGLMADGGGIQGLIRQIPFKQAMEIILSGEFIDAKKGYEIGIVNRLSKKEDLMKEVNNLADSILKCSPMAIQAAKQSAVLGKDMNYDDARIAEFSMFTKLKKSNDFVEGPKAFSEKRNPKWKSE